MAAQTIEALFLLVYYSLKSVQTVFDNECQPLNYNWHNGPMFFDLFTCSDKKLVIILFP